MYCKNCGKIIDADSVFCSFCGTKQSELNKTILSDSKESIPLEAKTVNVNLTLGLPSFKKEREGKVKIEKYDLGYKKESEATFVGILVLIGSIGFIVVSQNQNNAHVDAATAQVLGLIGVVTRICLIIWCVKIAQRQNRNTFGWGFFSFFLPSIALIIIGQTKKFKDQEIDEHANNSSSKLLSIKIDETNNPNNFPIVNLPLPPSDLISPLGNNSFTLKRFIAEYERYGKEYGKLLPMYSAIELNKRGEILDKELLGLLNKYASTFGYFSFDHMLNVS